MPVISKIRSLFKSRATPPAPGKCDNCAFVEFFRSNGDGQVTRLNAFCRCPAGPYEDRPVPAGRQCERWQRAEQVVVQPSVGDPNLTV